MDIRVNGRSYSLHAKRGRSGLIMATCPEMPGLHVMERTWGELAASARDLIPVLQAADSAPEGGR